MRSFFNKVRKGFRNFLTYSVCTFCQLFAGVMLQQKLLLEFLQFEISLQRHLTVLFTPLFNIC